MCQPCSRHSDVRRTHTAMPSPHAHIAITSRPQRDLGVISACPFLTPARNSPSYCPVLVRSEPLPSYLPVRLANSRKRATAMTRHAIAQGCAHRPCTRRRIAYALRIALLGARRPRRRCLRQDAAEMQPSHHGVYLGVLSPLTSATILLVRPVFALIHSAVRIPAHQMSRDIR